MLRFILLEMFPRIFLLLFLLLFSLQVAGEDRLVSIEIPPSKEAGELQIGVVHRLWIPGGVDVLTWNARADFESGIGAFVILADGKEIARIPDNPKKRFGRPLFQSMSYHDTPEIPLPEMKFKLPGSVSEGAKIGVISVNSVGLRSKPTHP